MQTETITISLWQMSHFTAAKYFVLHVETVRSFTFLHIQWEARIYFKYTPAEQTSAVSRLSVVLSRGHVATPGTFPLWYQVLCPFACVAVSVCEVKGSRVWLGGSARPIHNWPLMSSCGARPEHAVVQIWWWRFEHHWASSPASSPTSASASCSTRGARRSGSDSGSCVMWNTRPIRR